MGKFKRYFLPLILVVGGLLTTVVGFSIAGVAVTNKLQGDFKKNMMEIESNPQLYFGCKSKYFYKTNSVRIENYDVRTKEELKTSNRFLTITNSKKYYGYEKDDFNNGYYFHICSANLDNSDIKEIGLISTSHISSSIYAISGFDEYVYLYDSSSRWYATFDLKSESFLTDQPSYYGSFIDYYYSSFGYQALYIDESISEDLLIKYGDNEHTFNINNSFKNIHDIIKNYDATYKKLINYLNHTYIVIAGTFSDHYYIVFDYDWTLNTESYVGFTISGIGDVNVYQILNDF